MTDRLDLGVDRLSPELEERVEQLAQWLTKSPLLRSRPALRKIAKEAADAATMSYIEFGRAAKESK